MQLNSNLWNMLTVMLQQSWYKYQGHTHTKACKQTNTLAPASVLIVIGLSNPILMKNWTKLEDSIEKDRMA